MPLIVNLADYEATNVDDHGEALVCPVVGTTNTVLPPSHPEVDLSRPGLTCPVVGATTDHHRTVLRRHPDVAVPPEAMSPTGLTHSDANQCPFVKAVVAEPLARSLDEAICPIAGPVTTILPPDHPSTQDQPDNAVCPVTHASVAHHRRSVVRHPEIAAQDKGAVCPVVGHN